MKKNRMILIAAFAGLAAVGAYFYFTKNIEHVPFKTFYNDAAENKISMVTISSDKIRFTYCGGSTEFQTENPGSPTLKEYLMLNDIIVKEEKDGTEILSIIFDIAFYVIFFGVILFVFRKFISPNTFKTISKTGVKFSDIVGMEPLKKDMLQIADILKNPKEYKAKGIRLPKGILLEGAPGNGKTLFARALAGEAKVNFIPAKATDFESMFMAIGPAKVKLLFAKARRKAPCIVFIDEFDGIGTRRNYSGSAIETENTRIVTALLNELDGFHPNNGILVMAATNSREALDPALIRPGRFDAKYTVPYPDTSAREELIALYSKNKKPAENINIKDLARNFNGFSCAQIESVINRAAIVAAQNNRTEYNMEDIKTALKEI
jgi:cell division protease FtsH